MSNQEFPSVLVPPTKEGWFECEVEYNGSSANTETRTFWYSDGKWFDDKWQPQLNSKEWHDAVSFYVDLLQKCGVPGAANNGFSESLTLMSQGQAAMWVDATVAAGFLTDPSQSKIVDETRYS